MEQQTSFQKHRGAQAGSSFPDRHRLRPSIITSGAVRSPVWQLGRSDRPSWVEIATPDSSTPLQQLGGVEPSIDFC